MEDLDSDTMDELPDLVPPLNSTEYFNCAISPEVCRLACGPEWGVGTSGGGKDCVPNFVELNAADAQCKPEAAGLVRGPDITVDSGAAVGVTNPDHFPGVALLPNVC